MKQPELGKKISEIRNQKGISQKALSEACNIDIRTVQRIESGEVIPRSSTLKLIAATLDYDFDLLNGSNLSDEKSYLSKVYIFTLISGIIYFVNFIFYTRLIPGLTFKLNPQVYFVSTIIHILTGVLFYYGYYALIKERASGLLRTSFVILIIMVPVFVISTMFSEKISQGIVILMAINGILLGIGLMKVKSQFSFLFKIAGILQIITNPFFIFSVNYIGLWLSIPFFLLLLIIAYLEYLQMKTTELRV